MKFAVIPYMKGTSNRGYILGAVDEILLSLDDSSMNLQVCSLWCYLLLFMVMLIHSLKMQRCQFDFTLHQRVIHLILN